MRLAARKDRREEFLAKLEREKVRLFIASYMQSLFLLLQ